MDSLQKISPAHQDERGEILDLFDGKDIAHIGYITSKKGSVRGNHFHKKATQYTYILKGKMEWFTKDTRNPDSPVQSKIVTANDLTIDLPEIAHTFVALEDTEFIFFTDVSRANNTYGDDTFKCDLV